MQQLLKYGSVLEGLYNGHAMSTQIESLQKG